MKKPNILFILADQHRYDCTGPNPKYPVKTPNISSLAADGAVFNRAITSTPVCAPARQAILSGKRAESFGALWNYDFIKTNTLEPTGAYWSDMLASEGYNTTFGGKWHSSMGNSADKFGYQDIFTDKDYAEFANEKYGEIEYTGGWFGEHNPVSLEDSRTHWYADKICKTLDQYGKSDNPWHIRLDLSDPHLPCRPSAPFSTMYNPKDMVPWESFGDKFINKPYIQAQQIRNWGLDDLTWEDFAPCVARYFGMISQIDDAVGIIINKLKAMGEYDNTLIIYTSDHGDLCGGHGMMDKHYVLYDDVIRVPFILRYPTVCPQKIEIDDYTYSTLDVAPTIYDVLGKEIPDQLQGASLLPLLKGDRSNARDMAVTGANGQQFGSYTHRAVRCDEWKYCWNPTDIDELYDLENDPGEHNNLINDKQFFPIIKDLRLKMYNELKRCGDPFICSGWNDRMLLENKKG